MFNYFKKMIQSKYIQCLNELSYLINDKEEDKILNIYSENSYRWQLRELEISILKLKIVILQTIYKEK